MFSDFICNETLATSISWEDDSKAIEVEADDKKWKLSIEKA